jgi:N-acetyl-beta-hexosaminidase
MKGRSKSTLIGDDLLKILHVMMNIKILPSLTIHWGRHEAILLVVKAPHSACAKA